MPELRQNFFTKEWVIIATERAKRPEELATHREPQTVPSFVETAHSAPATRVKTPPEVLRLPGNTDEPSGGAGDPQQIRRALKRGPTYAQRAAFAALRSGVRVPRSDHRQPVTTPAAWPCCRMNRWPRFCARTKNDTRLLSMDHRINHVTIFKNHGVDAGASLQHPHSQLIATPVIPSQVRNRLHEALRHYDDAGECMFCHMVEREIEDQTRIVLKERTLRRHGGIRLAHAICHSYLSSAPHGQLRIDRAGGDAGPRPGLADSSGEALYRTRESGSQFHHSERAFRLWRRPAFPLVRQRNSAAHTRRRLRVGFGHVHQHRSA